MYLIASSSKGISSLKLASLRGLQYRTTWHLTHRIRAMMDSDPELLKGIVELDETFMGGKPHASNKPQPPAPIPLFEEPKAEQKRIDKPIVGIVFRDDQNPRPATISDTPIGCRPSFERAPVKPAAAVRRWPERPGFTGIRSKKTIRKRCDCRLQVNVSAAPL